MRRKYAPEDKQTISIPIRIEAAQTIGRCVVFFSKKWQAVVKLELKSKKYCKNTNLPCPYTDEQLGGTSKILGAQFIQKMLKFLRNF
jgi:hypothetical protein